MEKTTLRIRLTFTEDLLGSQSANPDLHEEYIASRAPTAERAREEVASIPKGPARSEANDATAPTGEEFEKGMTVFARDKGGALHMWDYQVKGFLKEAIKALINGGDENFKTLKAYKSVIADHVFVFPRRIMLKTEQGKAITSGVEHFSRPLRGQTAQGERICLATSEVVPAGSYCDVEIQIMGKTDSRSDSRSIRLEGIKAALEYGELKGLGQWRSGSYGRFNTTYLDETRPKENKAKAKEAKPKDDTRPVKIKAVKRK